MVKTLTPDRNLDVVRFNGTTLDSVYYRKRLSDGTYQTATRVYRKYSTTTLPYNINLTLTTKYEKQRIGALYTASLVSGWASTGNASSTNYLDNYNPLLLSASLILNGITKGSVAFYNGKAGKQITGSTTITGSTYLTATGYGKYYFELSVPVVVSISVAVKTDPVASSPSYRSTSYTYNISNVSLPYKLINASGTLQEVI